MIEHNIIILPKETDVKYVLLAFSKLEDRIDRLGRFTTDMDSSFKELRSIVEEVVKETHQTLIGIIQSK